MAVNRPSVTSSIRRARAADLPRVGEVAAEVFAPYGSDYGEMIPAYGRDPRVITLVAEKGRELVGFIQVGFLEAEPGRRDLVADILSVAAVPGHQGQGIGSSLFRRIFELLKPMRERGTVQDILLTVADSNLDGTRLFERLGFQVRIADYGLYEGGQRAIRMGRGDPPPGVVVDLGY